MKKKYQIFVSSTYLDLRDERQSAVEAILKAGHIPAGMELFAAGNKSQMAVIKKWIDESDIYMLILGFRYGSLDDESKLSYTELEFDYAVSKNKPFFAVVMNEATREAKVKKEGTAILEGKNEDKLRAFREKVCNNHVCKFFGDNKDIQLSIHESIHQLIDEFHPIGWVRASSVIDAAQVESEKTPLKEEIKRLQNEIVKLAQERDSSLKFGVHTYGELVEVLASQDVTINGKKDHVLNFMIIYGDSLTQGVTNEMMSSPTEIDLYRILVPKLAIFGLADQDTKVPVRMQWSRWRLSSDGRRFLALTKMKISQLNKKKQAEEMKRV